MFTEEQNTQEGSGKWHISVHAEENFFESEVNFQKENKRAEQKAENDDEGGALENDEEDKTESSSAAQNGKNIFSKQLKGNGAKWPRGCSRKNASKELRKNGFQ